jgi:hypothetical protein
MIFWIDRDTDQPRQVDFVIRTEGAPVHVMHIRDIQIDNAIDPSLFEVEIPADYTAFQPGEEEAGIRYPGLEN